MTLCFVWHTPLPFPPRPHSTRTTRINPDSYVHDGPFPAAVPRQARSPSSGPWILRPPLFSPSELYYPVPALP